MTRPIRFTQAQVERAIYGVKKAGLPITGLRFDPDGGFRVLCTQQKPANDEKNDFGDDD